MEFLGDMWVYIPHWKTKKRSESNSLSFHFGVMLLFGVHLETKERNCQCHLNFTLSQCESYFHNNACSEPVSMVAKTETLVNWFGRVISRLGRFTHGERSKKILQQVLLPHEIVANFLAIGEVRRMIGREVPCQNVCFGTAAIGILK